MAENRRFGREPVQIPTVTQDFCNLTYGDAAPATNYGFIDVQPFTVNDSKTFGDVDSTLAIAELENLACFKSTGDFDSPALAAAEDKSTECGTFLTALRDAEEVTIDFYAQVEEKSGDTVQTNFFNLYNASTDRNVFRVFYQQSTGGTSTDNLIYARAETAGGSLIFLGDADEAEMPAKSQIVSNGFVRFTITYRILGNGDQEFSVYINGSLVRNDLSIVANSLADIDVTATQVRIGGSDPTSLTDVAPAELSRIRIYKRWLTSSEITGAFDPDDADLIFNMFEDTAVVDEDRCNAATATNFLRFSETFNSLGWPSSTSLREGTDGQFDGFSMYRLTVPSGETSLSESSEFSTFIIDEGALATFTFVYEKTAFSAVVKPGLSLEEFDGVSSIFNTYDVEFESDTGAFIAEFKSTSKDVAYSTEDLGTHVRVRLTIFGADAGVEQSNNQAVIRLQSASAGDSLLVGSATLSNDDDTDAYSATFGVQRLQTGTDKCFNTRSTCQDPANYDKGTLPLRFVDKRSNIPKDDYYIPSLTGVRVTPAKLNPGGADRNARALGQRASIRLTFQDHPHNDRAVDKYRAERDYDPTERGTFWTKWRARNPYYMQRPIQLLSGYLVDGEVVDPITRDFVVTGFTGPDAAGRVTIEGKDVLTLAEDDKAQAPVASRGKLLSDITAGATSLTLNPAGIGDDEYPASGQVRVGKEVMDFTRSGDDLTITRGQFGTEAKAHDEGDLVQLCLRYVSEAPQDILEDLLLNYANIPASYLNKVQWDAEALDYLPRLYSAIITEPVGVSKLISEMAQQMYFTIWWDERTGKVVLRAVRLAQDDEVFELDDNAHLVEDSISWTDLADELITQVWMYYGQIDPTDKLDQGSNYSTIAITADPSAEGADKHNLRRVKTIFSRWIDATNASAAEDLGQRILSRYGNAPRQVTFRVDAKDDYLWLGEYVRLTNRLRTNRFGEPEPVNVQIFEAEEATLGSEYKFVAQEFIPALIGGEEFEDPTDRTIPITSDLLNVNLRQLHDSLFGAPSGTETVTFVVRSGVTVGGDTRGGGVNVPAGQRVTTNDFYDAGAALQSGFQVGTIPALQRRSISSPRTISAGSSYDAEGNASWTVKEYPVSVAVNTGTWPSGVTLKIVLESGARILGEGASGSCHKIDEPAGDAPDIHTPISGGDGGDAFEILYPVEITNGGVVGGGGGGGSGVFTDLDDAAFGNLYLEFIPGGGGAGYFFGPTATPTFRNDNGANISLLFARKDASTVKNASAGSLTAGGSGGRAVYDTSRQDLFSIAGAGGALARNGAASSYLDERIDSAGNTVTVADFTYNKGGQPGKAVRAGANLITWVNRGDVRGDEVT